MRGTKANAKARTLGGREERHYEAAFMRPTGPRHNAEALPEADPRGWPLLAQWGAPLPCYAAPKPKGRTDG